MATLPAPLNVTLRTNQTTRIPVMLTSGHAAIDLTAHTNWLAQIRPHPQDPTILGVFTIPKDGSDHVITDSNGAVPLAIQPELITTIGSTTASAYWDLVSTDGNGDEVCWLAGTITIVIGVSRT